ncbi:MAG: hypothetical protein GOMPHAMPRED_006659 [Gomphillus americanus]|uniref:Uncharacterized protein n=1 Tax=Gomphillus americanus TaxID=1940652 RepID=A0A8H3FZ51_9LECA|nr:MAG: hypothetical protein GOMPHAMPRED_006659 [Gomphillus americanus]
MSEYCEVMIKRYPRLADDYKRLEYDKFYGLEYLHVRSKNWSLCPGSELVNQKSRKTRLPAVYYGTIGSANQARRNTVLRDKPYKGSTVYPEADAAGTTDVSYMLIYGIRGELQTFEQFPGGHLDYCDTHESKD